MAAVAMEASKVLVLGADKVGKKDVVAAIRSLCGVVDASPSKEATMTNVELVQFRTKYYEADIEFHVHRVRENEWEMALAHEMDEYEAIVCVTDVQRVETFLHIHKLVENVMENQPSFEVCLFIGNKSTKSTSQTHKHVQRIEGWCQENAFEFIHVPERSAIDNQEEITQSESNETEGMKRVLEALHCNMWKSMRMVSPSQPATTSSPVEKKQPHAVKAADTSNNIDDYAIDNQQEENEAASEDKEALEALLGSMALSDADNKNAEDDGEDRDDNLDMHEFSSLLNEVRRIREHGQALSDDQRRQQAEQVAMRLWNFLGCDDDSDGGSDSDTDRQ